MSQIAREDPRRTLRDDHRRRADDVRRGLHVRLGYAAQGCQYDSSSNAVPSKMRTFFQGVECQTRASP
jgi:hypothetical protein